MYTRQQYDDTSKQSKDYKVLQKSVQSTTKLTFTNTCSIQTAPFPICKGHISVIWLFKEYILTDLPGHTGVTGLCRLSDSLLIQRSWVRSQPVAEIFSTINGYNAHSHSSPPSNRPDMTEILFKKTKKTRVIRPSMETTLKMLLRVI